MFVVSNKGLTVVDLTKPLVEADKELVKTLIEFCYGVYNQCGSFIYLDLMVKIGRYLLRGILSGGLVPISVDQVPKLLIY
jgi:hypothetical protein